MPDRDPRPPLRALILRIVLIALVMAGAAPATIATEPAPDAQIYIGHRARLTAQVPGDWTVPADGHADYARRDGFVVSYALMGANLDDACDELASTYSQGTTSPATWQGDDACRIEGEADGRPVVGLVVAHPHPFAIYGQEVRFAAIVADPGHIDAIAASLSFDAGLVTPEAFAGSVLDLMEARAYWSGDVDWAALRAEVAGLIDGSETLADTHVVITQALNRLRSAGDNHSFLIEDTATWGRVAEGFGMLVEGHTVALVYPDSPAGHAGIQTGDRIVSVNGQPLRRPLYREDLGSMWVDPVEVTVRRPGVAEPIAVELAPETFDTYIPPTVGRVNDAIGYVELFAFASAGREENYASAANDGIARIDDDATCGWIVDLRRNQGGSYYPMVTGVGSILGDGPILTWVLPDGTTTIVAYRDGAVIDDGRSGKDLVQGPVHALQTPDPPVAVLIGPWTASSGEATTLAFVGRPDTRLIGTTTAGFTTGNSSFALFDGSVIALATVAMADRTGATHMDGIVPDEAARTDWATYGSGDDPAIAAATAWLEKQPACAAATPVVTSGS